MKRRFRSAVVAALLLVAPGAHANDVDSDPCLAFVEVLARDDVPGAVSLLLAGEQPQSENDAARLDRARRYLEQALESRLRDLGGIQTFKRLDSQPEDASWLKKSGWRLREEKPEDPVESFYRATFAYYGDAFLQMACSNDEIVEFGIGIPGSDPENKRRIGEMDLRETRMLHEIYSND